MNVTEAGILEPTPSDSISQIEALAHNYALGQQAIEELKVLKPVLAYAISKLPKQQIKVTLTDQANVLPQLELQHKYESNGAIVLRAVKA